MCQSYKWKRGVYRFAFIIKALVFIKLFNLGTDLNVCDKAQRYNVYHLSYRKVNLKPNLDAQQA
jgi:hypothetical protein